MLKKLRSYLVRGLCLISLTSESMIFQNFIRFVMEKSTHTHKILNYSIQIIGFEVNINAKQAITTTNIVYLIYFA